MMLSVAYSNSLVEQLTVPMYSELVRGEITPIVRRGQVKRGYGNFCDCFAVIRGVRPKERPNTG